MMNIKKKACAFALGVAVLGGSAYWAWHTYDSFNTAQENDLLLENIEALAIGEDIKPNPRPYFNMHLKCHDPLVGYIGECLCSSEPVTEGGNSTHEHKHSCKKCCSD